MEPKPEQGNWAVLAPALTTGDQTRQWQCRINIDIVCVYHVIVEALATRRAFFSVQFYTKVQF